MNSPNSGPTLATLAPLKMVIFLRRLQMLLLGMGRKIFSGRLLGSTKGGQKTLHHPFFFISPSGRDAPWPKLWRKCFEWPTSNTKEAYVLKTLSNLPSYGRWFKRFIWTLMRQIQFFGSSMMDATLPSRFISCNFLVTPSPPCLLWFGNLGHLPNARRLLGWSSKIVFERQID
jgi:hypothetical protein